MKIKKGDEVLVIKGKDKGKKGKVLRGFPKELKILVEGVNIKKKHQRPRKEGEKGQIIEKIFPFPVSKVKLICPYCKRPTRVGYKIKLVSFLENKKSLKKEKLKRKKIRICKKCQKEI